MVGLSGGLDSTLAVLITALAMQMLGRPATDIIAVTMPGFGTTGRTRNNAGQLCELMGVRLQEVNITAAVRQHFADTVAAVEKYHAKLLVLDEVLDAVAIGMLSDEELAEFLRNRPEDLEVVMTGRAPTPCTDPLADYITRMEKVRHPFDKGLNARKGVEF